MTIDAKKMCGRSGGISIDYHWYTHHLTTNKKEGKSPDKDELTANSQIILFHIAGFKGPNTGVYRAARPQV